MAGRSKGWRTLSRRGKRVLVIDFYFLDRSGRRQRFRKDASVQTATAATAEARRLQAFASENGHVEGVPSQRPLLGPVEVMKPKLMFKDFVNGTFTKDFMPGYKPSTKRRYQDLFDQGMLAAIGDIAIEDFGANEYRQYAATIIERDVQLKGPLNLVKTVLRAAEASGVIAARPSLPKLFKEPKKLPKGPRLNDMADQIAASPRWLQVALGLAAYGGLRSGEIRALQVRHLDFVERRIHVELALSDDTETSTKSDDERWAPIPDPLLPLLMDAKRNKLPNARVVVTPRGRTPTRQNLLNALRRVQRKAGLKTWNVHSLRHGFCSHMTRSKVSIETVRRMAGHANLATTARYLHADVDDIHEAMDLFSEGSK